MKENWSLLAVMKRQKQLINPETTFDAVNPSIKKWLRHKHTEIKGAQYKENLWMHKGREQLLSELIRELEIDEIDECYHASNESQPIKPDCLGKYGELNLKCESCDLYKPKSECYKAKWGDTPDNDDDCGMSGC